MPLEIRFLGDFIDFGKENGGKLAPNSEPKSMLPLKRKNQLNASRLAPNWVRGDQVGTKNRWKIHAKRHLTLDFKFASIFDRFLLPTWTLRTQFGTSRLAFSWFFRFSAKIDFGSDFGAILLPFSSQNPPKFHQKSISKGIQKIIDFRIDFYAVLAPTWSHLGPQVGAILALKIAQEPPRTLLHTHLGARTRPDP